MKKMIIIFILILFYLLNLRISFASEIEGLYMIEKLGKYIINGRFEVNRTKQFKEFNYIILLNENSDSEQRVYIKVDPKIGSQHDLDNLLISAKVNISKISEQSKYTVFADLLKDPSLILSDDLRFPVTKLSSNPE